MLKKLLHELEIEIGNHIVNFGGVNVSENLPEDLSVETINQTARENDLSIVDQEKADEIRAYIDQIKKKLGIPLAALLRYGSKMYLLAWAHMFSLTGS